MSCIRCGGSRVVGRVPCGLCRGRGRISPKLGAAYLESEKTLHEVLGTDRFRYHGVRVVQPTKEPIVAAPQPMIFEPTWWRRLWDKLRGKR